MIRAKPTFLVIDIDGATKASYPVDQSGIIGLQEPIDRYVTLLRMNPMSYSG
jgi:hypothetical protein